MTTYAYTGNGKYIEGLPCGNLDTATMTTEQLALLTEALSAGIYSVGATTFTVRPTAIEQEPED
jgi:hypothetical protein